MNRRDTAKAPTKPLPMMVPKKLSYDLIAFASLCQLIFNLTQVAALINFHASAT